MIRFVIFFLVERLCVVSCCLTAAALIADDPNPEAGPGDENAHHTRYWWMP